ncbi:hypothetical protein SAPIO_CDS0465 [Scedosporium apiospermum]|uniref:Uncharacterized protein n=1 Tax=Pseudallescheria apiosperma TaxID=563466 RepID=A0A084GH26_PSEDA|nr:uncharacterized protein SAPIO_CDS0465 [Scedosporium apiospermum]KEZ46638.1 hypothetical protein SAPIO_CDS0465 [Scedosporium apiospermum]
MDPMLMYLIFKLFFVYAYAGGAPMMSNATTTDPTNNDEPQKGSMVPFFVGMALGFSFCMFCLYLAGAWFLQGIGGFIGTLLLGIVRFLPRVIFTVPGKLIVGFGRLVVRVGAWVYRLPDAGRNVNRRGRGAAYLWPGFAHVETYIPAIYTQSLLRKLRNLGAVHTRMVVLSEGPFAAHYAHVRSDEALYRESLNSRRDYVLYELGGLHRAFVSIGDEQNAALVDQLLSGVQTAFGQAEAEAHRAFRRRGHGGARGGAHGVNQG